MAEHTALNFAVLGPPRSGIRVVQSALHRRDDVVCYADLLHADTNVRRDAHREYFGAAGSSSGSKANPDIPEWFAPHLVSPCQYIAHTVFDADRGIERAVGLSVDFLAVHDYELWDFFAQRCRLGDFCLIIVDRNPAACFVSLRQAEQSGRWYRPLNEAANALPPPVNVIPDELTTFCRRMASAREKTRAACDDTLLVKYSDLLISLQPTMSAIFQFIERAERPEPARPSCRRLRNRPMAQRITNLPKLRSAVPSDIRELLDAEDFQC